MDRLQAVFDKARQAARWQFAQTGCQKKGWQDHARDAGRVPPEDVAALKAECEALRKFEPHARAFAWLTARSWFRLAVGRPLFGSLAPDEEATFLRKLGAALGLDLKPLDASIDAAKEGK